MKILIIVVANLLPFYLNRDEHITYQGVESE